jgi:hypothetical protein
MKKIICLAIVTFLIHASSSSAQTLGKNDLVQFSGVVVTGDSLMPVPFSNIMIKDSYRGTVSDYYGFFSFVARMNDTIFFSALGFKRGTFVIPDTLSDSRCSLIQILKSDTILLKEAVIYLWPTKEQFKEAFLALRVPDGDLERAQHNLEQDRLAYLATNLAMDGSMNFRNQMQTQTSRLYYAGQLPPNQLLNPLAWAKFIKAWQNGDFKRKEKK